MGLPGVREERKCERVAGSPHHGRHILGKPMRCTAGGTVLDLCLPESNAVAVKRQLNGHGGYIVWDRLACYLDIEYFFIF
jgi:hypothetical protein